MKVEEAVDLGAVVAVADRDTSVAVAAVVADLAAGRSDLAWRDCSSFDCEAASESVKTAYSQVSGKANCFMPKVRH